MPIYKQDESGKFVPFEEMPFPDLEKVLEDWIEANPHLVLDDETLAFFARQPRTRFDKYLDLLGLDKTGATVIVELKRGETPRDVVAQTLEYAAWVDSLTIDQMDEMAREYAEKHGFEADGIADLYSRTFSVRLEGDEEEEAEVAERITFNNRQRLVILAERISGEVEQTLRYLRTRFGADVYGVEFSVHRTGEDTIINTTTVVGREPVSKPAQTTWQTHERESDESILNRVKTDFMRRAVTAIEGWVDGSDIDGLRVDHSTESSHYIRYLGLNWLYYYYAANWLYMLLYGATHEQLELLRGRLSKPESLFTKETWGGGWRFHVTTDEDLEAIKDVILRRVEVHSRQKTA